MSGNMWKPRRSFHPAGPTGQASTAASAPTSPSHAGIYNSPRFNAAPMAPSFQGGPQAALRATEKGTSSAADRSPKYGTSSATATPSSAGDRSPKFTFKVPSSSNLGQQPGVSAQSRERVNSSSAISTTVPSSTSGSTVPSSPSVNFSPASSASGGRPPPGASVAKGPTAASFRSCSPKGHDYLLPYQRQALSGNRGRTEPNPSSITWQNSNESSSGAFGQSQSSRITFPGHKDHQFKPGNTAHAFKPAMDSPLITPQARENVDRENLDRSAPTVPTQSASSTTLNRENLDRSANGSGPNSYEFGPAQRLPTGATSPTSPDSPPPTLKHPHFSTFVGLPKSTDVEQSARWRDRSMDTFECQSETGSNRLDFLITDKDIETAKDRAHSESKQFGRRAHGNKKLPDVREALVEDAYEDADGEKSGGPNADTDQMVGTGWWASTYNDTPSRTRVGGPPRTTTNVREITGGYGPGATRRPVSAVSLSNQHAQSTGGLFGRVLSEEASGSGSLSPEVFLNVYEVGQLPGPVHSLLATLNTGAFHVGVEVYGIEYSYGLSRGPRICGLEASRKPKNHPLHKYTNTIQLGRTHLKSFQVEQRVRELGPLWLGKDYDAIRRNCVTFAEQFSQELGVQAPPASVGSLTRKLHGLIGD